MAEEAEAWITGQLVECNWPGNIRELEQCIRNVMIRGEYWPTESLADADAGDAHKQWLRDAEQGRLSADDLLAHYCAWMYARLGTYEATAQALGIDRRTVKSKVERVGR